jgi:hypothetical protein
VGDGWKRAISAPFCMVMSLKRLKDVCAERTHGRLLRLKTIPFTYQAQIIF